MRTRNAAPQTPVAVSRDVLRGLSRTYAISYAHRLYRAAAWPYVIHPQEILDVEQVTEESTGLELNAENVDTVRAGVSFGVGGSGVGGKRVAGCVDAAGDGWLVTQSSWLPQPTP